MNRFRDRSDAGRVLAMALEEYRGRADVIVLGLPRGGVPVAAEVASALGAPLDVFVVRKLGMPGHEEFAIGAIASGGNPFAPRYSMRAPACASAATRSPMGRSCMRATPVSW